VTLHAFSSAITLAASLHLMAGIPNGLVLEYDQTPNALRDELLGEPLTMAPDGSMHVPDGPGLGVHLDPAAVDRYRV
jgi:D-galactarolactone cycloisomerase